MAIWGLTQVNLMNQNYIMGWLRDYLWLNSSPLINGYNPFGTCLDMDVLIWSLSLGNRFHVLNFMDVVAGEISETLVWAHEHH
jgi:photosystem I P700 chlorophyll a apoprotein A2